MKGTQKGNFLYLGKDLHFLVVQKRLVNIMFFEELKGGRIMIFLWEGPVQKQWQKQIFDIRSFVGSLGNGNV